MAHEFFPESDVVVEPGDTETEGVNGGSIFLEQHPQITRLLLQLLFVALLIKRIMRFCWSKIERPLRFLARLFVRTVGIRIYRVGFVAAQMFRALVEPVRRLTAGFLVHRYAVHGVMMLAAFVTGFLNLQQTEVRAATTGRSSLLFALVNGEQDVPIRVVANTSDKTRPIAYDTTFVLKPDPEPLTTGDPFIPSDTTRLPTAPLPPRTSITTYAVAEGDSLWSIAQKHNLKLNTVLWANQLTVRSVLKLGSELIIPPQDGVVYTVKTGDTVSSIATRYGIDSREILAANTTTSTSLSIGAKLILPGAIPLSTAPAAKPPVTARTVIPTITNTKPTTQPINVSGWTWPTDGRYITTGFGWKHTGIDIDCDGHKNGTSTQSNYAAADGIVQYAGWKSGYGNTVEINHDNGLVTRYGHFYGLSVTVGQQVTAGTNLGRCGSTGKSSGTHLHFEVIKNGKYQSPLNYVR